MTLTRRSVLSLPAAALAASTPWLGVGPGRFVVEYPLVQRARRPTPADPFWAFIGQESWDRSRALLSAESEERALELSEALGARYVVRRL